MKKRKKRGQTYLIIKLQRWTEVTNCSLTCGQSETLAEFSTKQINPSPFFGTGPRSSISFRSFSGSGSGHRKKSSRALSHAQPICVTPDTIVIAEARLAGAVCWYLKRDNIYIIGHGGEFKYGLSYYKSSARRLDLKPMADFIRQHPGKIVLVARVKKLNQWQNVLPQPVSTTNNGEKGVAIWKF